MTRIFLCLLALLASIPAHAAVGETCRPATITNGGARLCQDAINPTYIPVVPAAKIGPHASTHLPGGSDALTTAAPTTVTGSSNSAGSAASFARSDHQHALGTHASTHGSAGADAVSLDGSQISAGTVADARLPTTLSGHTLSNSTLSGITTLASSPTPNADNTINLCSAGNRCNTVNATSFSSGSTTHSLLANVPNSGGSVAFDANNGTTMTVGTLFRIRNNGTTRFAVAPDGTVSGATVPASALGSGIAFYAYVATPAAASTTGLATALAANSGTNSFTGLSNPDKCRGIQVTTGAAWDGGNITLTGTNCDGSAYVETVFVTPGSTVLSIGPFATLTAATKGTVGASADTATLGPGNYLGLATGTRRIQTAQCVITVNNVLDSAVAVISNPSVDPSVFPNTAPNGARNYQIVCGLL